MASFISGQVGNGPYFSCFHLHQDDRSMVGFMSEKLGVKCIMCHILQIHIDGGDHIVAILGFDFLGIINGHPDIPADFSHKAVTLHAFQLNFISTLYAHHTSRIPTHGIAHCP